MVEECGDETGVKGASEIPRGKELSPGLFPYSLSPIHCSICPPPTHLLSQLPTPQSTHPFTQSSILHPLNGHTHPPIRLFIHLITMSILLSIHHPPTIHPSTPTHPPTIHASFKP